MQPLWALQRRLPGRSIFMEMRREAVERGRGTFPEHKRLIGYERRGMSKRFSWYGLPEGCTTIFFPGCALPGTRPAATLAVYEKLQETIPALGLVMDCCTKPSHDLGRQQFFREMFGEMAAWLEDNGVQRILVACPNCYKVFSEYAPRFQTETVYEALAETLPGSGAATQLIPVTIHDPCVIRFSSAPQISARSLIAGSGRMIEEMPHTRRSALCCGEGGTVGVLAAHLADSWGERRVEEASGRQVITYCAGCANYLGKRLKVSHVLDVIFNTPKPSSGLMTYLNRLRLKSHFKKIVPALITRERIISTTPKLTRWYKKREKQEQLPILPWSLQKSLRRKALVIGSLSMISLAVYALIRKFFWALDAYMYTIEFNLLFIASRLRDADLAGFIEYLLPMSTVRGAGIALLTQAMQTFVFPFSSLKSVVAFNSAFGTSTGVLYSGSAALITISLAALCGRLILGDLLPLYNRQKGTEPLSPSSPWILWCVAVLTAIPAVPLLPCGLLTGVLRTPSMHLLPVIAAALAVRILISVVAQ